MIIDILMWATLLVLTALLVFELTSKMPDTGELALKHMAWAAFAWVVSRDAPRAYLIKRAMRTPYSHLPGYMNRYWLFNAYDKINGNEVTPIKWLPSIRVHHILRRDEDQHMHDHPWDARTVILKGFYTESRPDGHFLRTRGYTGPINHGEYHTITSVSDGGVWTLFITFGFKSGWGFLVDGKKVPWREYMDMNPDGPWSEQEKPQ